MIIIGRTNPNPYPVKIGQAIKESVSALPEIPEKLVDEVCPCDIGLCEYVNKVFGSTENDFWKNDKSSFLLRRFIASDSIVIKLFKDGVELATITDNTYGEYYDGLPTQPLYTGFVLYWQNVFLLHGSGIYRLQFERNIIGQTTTDYSIKYNLLPYSQNAADFTVRLEWFQNGSIRSSLFDLTGQNWYQQFRFDGRFGNETPNLEVDNYINQDYRIEQIQDRINFEYDLGIDPIPVTLGRPIINDAILGNDVLVTDYNIRNYQQYIQFPVQAVSVDEAIEYTGNFNKQFLIKFTKRDDNHIKSSY